MQVTETECIPVIVGIGEIIDRPADPAESREPIELMATALQAADADSGGLLARIDSLDVVHQTSWSYTDTARAVCARIGLAPARAVYGVTGGESPVRYLHQAAMRIASGDSAVAAVVGAEAQYARARAKKSGMTLPWTPRAEIVENRIDPRTLYHPIAIAHHVLAPAEIYPLYENAATSAWGQTPGQATAESGLTWAGLAAVAAENPFAWSRQPLDAATIVTPSADNRLVAWPYTKRMVANPQVNQGAAIIVTSLAEARRAGIAEHRLIHIAGGAFANEPRDYLGRDRYDRSSAQEAVLGAAARLVPDDFDCVELYSCFPIVPKMARRTLGRSGTMAISVTGGLSFFGAPFNNYMAHATCAMVRALRDGPGATGLLYGQGEFVTKHHALVLSRERGKPLATIDAQALADAARGPIPPLILDPVGPATLETFTIVYDRNGDVRTAMVLARMTDGARAVARVALDDTAAIARLTALDISPIGAAGLIAAGPIAGWTFV